MKTLPYETSAGGATATRPAPVRPSPVRPAAARRPKDRRPPTALTAAEAHAAAERLTAALGRHYVDAQAGRVEVRRLRPLLTPTAEQRVRAAVLRARARHQLGAARPGARLRVRRVVVQRAGDHYEGLALVDDGRRTVAVTAVLHPTPRGWRVSDLARPDDGLPALPPPLLREHRPTYEA